MNAVVCLRFSPRNTYQTKCFNIALCDCRRHGYPDDHDLGSWTVDCHDLWNVHVVENAVTSIVTVNFVHDGVNTNTCKNTGKLFRIAQKKSVAANPIIPS